MATGLEGFSLMVTECSRMIGLPATAIGLAESGQLHLDAVDTVNAVDEENQDKYEGDLVVRQMCRGLYVPSFLPSCHIVASRLSGSRR